MQPWQQWALPRCQLVFIAKLSWKSIQGFVLLDFFLFVLNWLAAVDKQFLKKQTSAKLQ